jgi:EmrB/QacA subfamily drug resistance transporter
MTTADDGAIPEVAADASAAEAAGAPDPYARKWWVLVAVCLALFVAILDSTVVNIAIPTIVEDLGASLAEIEWVLNAYTLTFAALLITFGRLGDMYGRRRMFIVGLIVFGLGSAACGLAPTPQVLIAARVAQASGAAFMMPATLSLTAVSFPPEQRGLALGIWGAVSGVALAIGPTLGGLVTENLGWQYIFFINIPIIAVAIPFTLWAVRESRDERDHTLDWLGALLSIAVLVSFNYAMIEGPGRGWDDPLILGLLAASAVLLLVFVAWERRAKEPVLDLDLFRNRTFSAGNATGAVLMFGMMGVFFMVPLFLQTQLGFGAVRAGLALTPMSFAIMFAAPFSGRLSDRIGSKWLIFGGLLTAAASVWWLSYIALDTTVAWLAAPFIVAGIGMGLVMAPMTSAVMASAPEAEEGSAAGILSTMRQVGAVMGIAILGAVFASQMAAGIGEAVRETDTLPPELAASLADFVEAESGEMMGGPSLDMESLRDEIPEEAFAPLLAEAVADTIEEIPEDIRISIPPGALEAMRDSETLASGEGMPDEIAESMPPEMISMFESSVERNLAARFEEFGAEMEIASSQAFVESMSYAFRVAAIVLALGALIALAIRPGSNVEQHEEIEQTYAAH